MESVARDATSRGQKCRLQRDCWGSIRRFDSPTPLRTGRCRRGAGAQRFLVGSIRDGHCHLRYAFELGIRAIVAAQIPVSVN